MMSDLTPSVLDMSVNITLRHLRGAIGRLSTTGRNLDRYIVEQSTQNTSSSAASSTPDAEKEKKKQETPANIDNDEV